MKPFVHLHLHTEYSLLDGAIRIDELFKACKKRNMPAVAITDHGNMFGVVKFVDKCKKYNDDEKVKEREAKEKGEVYEPFFVKPIIGTEFYMCDDLAKKEGKPDMRHIILLAKTQEGYKNLVKLNSIAYQEGFYYKPRLDYKILKEHTKGLICLSGCLAGHVQQLLLNNLTDEAEKIATTLKGMFEPGDFYIELQDHGIEEQKRILPRQIELAKKVGVKCIITNDVHYLNKDDAESQDVMMCINMQKRVDDPDRLSMRTIGDEFYLKTYDEMAERFAYITEALDNTIEVAEKCDGKVEFNLPLAPVYEDLDGKTSVDKLQELVDLGIKEKYNNRQDAIDRAKYELSVINKMGFADYFLVVWDFINFCDNNDIPVGPGRGSGAGSVVAYVLNITRVDPLKYDLLFERFLNPDRISMPDIDTDFCFDRCTEVIEYVTKKYGRDRVCQIATFGTMKAKAAVKDVARVFNIPFAESNNLTKLMPNKIGDEYKKQTLRKLFGIWDSKEDEEKNKDLTFRELRELIDVNPTLRKVVEIAIKLENMPRHVSIHASGVVICRYKVSDYVPLAVTGGEIVTQYDMNELEHIGILKFDFLRLKNLTDIKRATDMIKESNGVDIDFYSSNFNYEDAGVYKMIADGDTDTVFQLESGGMKKFMKELKPSCMEDIIAGVAMYRPGPMDEIPNFIAGKHHPSKAHYDVEDLRPILSNTYGVMVYQEQVMKVCQNLAGYTLAQADNVRKFMGKKLFFQLQAEKKFFIEGDKYSNPPKIGTTANGYDKEIMEHLFDKMIKFGNYAFNKSHATVYAYIGYQTAYIKKYYEAEWLAAYLNNRITDIKELQIYIAYAKKRGVEVLPPDINKSDCYFKVEGKNIRYGLGALKGVGLAAVNELVSKRKLNGEFKNFYNFVENLQGSSMNKRFIESMIYSGALDCFGIKRSQIHEVYAEVVSKVSKAVENKASGQISFFDGDAGAILGIVDVVYPDIPEFNAKTKLKLEKEVAGFYISGHPLDEHYERFQKFNFDSSMIEVEEKDDFGEEESFGSFEEDATEIKRESKLTDNQSIVCGGMITNIKKMQTKKGNKELCFLTIEDLNGTFDVLVFEKLIEKYRNEIILDNCLTIHGRYSERGGQTPIVVADKFLFWNAEEFEEKKEDKPFTFGYVEEDKPKKLYLKYSSLDENINTRVLNVLGSNPGDSDVVIQCSETKQIFGPGVKVRLTGRLTNELVGLIGEKNLIVK